LSATTKIISCDECKNIEKLIRIKKLFIIMYGTITII